MAFKFAKGTAVRQIVKPIEGTVVGYKLDEERGETLALVEWAEPGAEQDEIEVKSRYFSEAELEVVA